MNDHDLTSHRPSPDPHGPHNQQPSAYLVLMILAGAGIGAALGVFAFKKAAYDSVGIIRIRPGFADPRNPTENAVAFFEQFIRSQALRITQQRVILFAMDSEIWRSTGRAAVEDPEAVVQFAESLSAQHTPRTEHVIVRFTDDDPVVARAGVMAALEAYQQIYGGEKLAGLERDLALIDDRTQVIAANLRTVMNKMELIVAPFGSAENLRSEHSRIKSDLDHLRRARNDAEIALTTLESTPPQLDATLNDAPRPDPALEQRAKDDPELAQLLNARSMLERSVAQLMEEHGREYQLLHDAQTSIESIDRQIQDHIGQPSDPMSSDLEIPRHRARIKVLDERIAATNVGSKSLGRKIEQAIIYEQQCRGYQDQIAQLEARRAQLAIRLYQPGFIEIEETGSEATPVTTPPNGLKILFGCIIGAFAGGAGFVLIKLA